MGKRAPSNTGPRQIQYWKGSMPKPQMKNLGFKNIGIKKGGAGQRKPK